MSANISLAKLATLGVSLAILGFIYWRIDFAGMLTVLAGAHVPLTILAFLLLVPLVMMASGRLHQLAGRDKRLSYAEASANPWHRSRIFPWHDHADRVEDFNRTGASPVERNGRATP